MARLWNWPPVISLAPNVIRSSSPMKGGLHSAIVGSGMMESLLAKSQRKLNGTPNISCERCRGYDGWINPDRPLKAGVCD